MTAELNPGKFSLVDLANKIAQYDKEILTDEAAINELEERKMKLEIPLKVEINDELIDGKKKFSTVTAKNIEFSARVMNNQELTDLANKLKDLTLSKNLKRVERDFLKRLFKIKEIEALQDIHKI